MTGSDRLEDKDSHCLLLHIVSGHSHMFLCAAYFYGDTYWQNSDFNWSLKAYVRNTIN